MEKYTITKEQILELHESNSPETRMQIAKMFPNAFKKELEFGKWYVYGRTLLNYQGLNDRYLIQAYGFLEDKSWIKTSNFGNNFKEWKEATDEKVEEALIAESKKRGYKKGVKVMPLYSDGSTHNDNVKILEDELSFDEHQNSLDFNNSSYRLFCQGKWAKIIPEETKVISIEKAIKILSKKYGQKVEIK